MFQFGFWQLMIVLVIVLAIFGPKNLPKLARMLGSGLREVKDIKDQLPTAEDFSVETKPVKPQQLEAKAEKRATAPRREGVKARPSKRA